MRRKKEEAEKTRRDIMAAALDTFDRLGIARTSLEDVAAAAGVTRGAIYWHFANKQKLLRAIREEVSLPLVDSIGEHLLSDNAADPLERVERFLLGLLELLERDERLRRIFAVMSFKCEYVGELEHELKESLEACHRLRESLAKVYRQARARRLLRDDVHAEAAALDTTVFLYGLLRVWLLDEAGTQIRRMAPRLVAAHVALRRAPGAARRAPMRGAARARTPARRRVARHAATRRAR